VPAFGGILIRIDSAKLARGDLQWSLSGSYNGESSDFRRRIAPLLAELPSPQLTSVGTDLDWLRRLELQIVDDSNWPSLNLSGPHRSSSTYQKSRAPPRLESAVAMHKGSQYCSAKACRSHLGKPPWCDVQPRIRSLKG
jgi:hypothetical protein